VPSPEQVRRVDARLELALYTERWQTAELVAGAQGFQSEAQRVTGKRRDPIAMLRVCPTP